MEMLKIVGFDGNGKEVFDGDYMVLDNGDIAYFYKVENGKPKVFANWTIASLGLIDYEDHHKQMMEANVPDNFKKTQQIYYNIITNCKTPDLQKVSSKMKYYLDLIQTNGEGHTYLEGSLENPTHEYEEEEY